MDFILSYVIILRILYNGPNRHKGRLMIGNKITQVAENLIVTIEYTLTVGKEILDSSDEEGPLEYLHGFANIIPGLEKELLGMRVGESKKVTVAPADGYGELEEDALMDVPRAEFPDDFPIEEGVELEIMDDDENIVLVTIVEVGDENIKLDTNHPLAGKVLNFEVTVTGLREASAEELDHGHVHVEGHHHD